MKTSKYTLLIGAAIVMFLLSGTAWADGRRGRQDNGGNHGYHQKHRQHIGPQARRPVPYHRPNHFGPKYHHKPQLYHGPRHHQGRIYAHPGYRQPHHRAYRAHTHRPVYGLHLSVFDPYFHFGFSTGGR